MSLGRTRRFNSSCSAVQAHNRTETPSLISLSSGWAIEGRAIRERGCRPPKGCFSTCNNTHAVARRMSSVAPRKIEGRTNYRRLSQDRRLDAQTASARRRYIPCCKRHSSTAVPSSRQCFWVRPGSNHFSRRIGSVREGPQQVLPGVTVQSTVSSKKACVRRWVGGCDSIVDAAGRRGSRFGDQLAIRRVHRTSRGAWFDLSIGAVPERRAQRCNRAD